MDQYPAQDVDTTGIMVDSNEVIDSPPPIPPSPFRKLIPFAIIAGILLIILLILMVFSAGNNTNNKNNPNNPNNSILTPTLRPTATPISVSTIPSITQPPVSSPSAIPVKVGRLIFIQNGNIYHSDFATISLLVKNTIQAGDKLTWSPSGNYIAWKPKTYTATPSAVTVYNLKAKNYVTIEPFSKSDGEVVDFTFSPDEKQLALILKDSTYRLSVYQLSSPSGAIASLTKNSQIKQIIWPKDQMIIYSGNEGIGSFDPKSNSENPLVQNASMQKIKLSPDKKKILYSLGNENKSDLYLYDIDKKTSEKITPIPPKVDMGSTGLPASILNNGFIPYAIFMPSGERLIVGYHYLTNLPLVGIYSLIDQSFTAITPFSLYDTDLMTDDFKLIGGRVENKTNSVSRHVSIFTLEDNAKFGLIRMIPDAYSPAFFGD